MAGLINELMEKLGGMADSVDALSEFAHAKKDVIINNDVDGLRKITSQENTLVGRYQKAEKAISEIMKDIAMVLNQNPAGLTLGMLGELIKDQDEHGDYVKVYDRLKKGIFELKERNDMNSALIENALEYINYTVNAVRSTYGTDGDSVLDTRN